MKVKRFIKGFIYLFPVLFVLAGGLTGILFAMSDNHVYVQRAIVSGSQYNNTTTYDNTFYTGVGDGFSTYMYNFVNLFVDEVPSDVVNGVESLLNRIGLYEEGDGLTFFLIYFITYEIFAIIICAVLDVIFLIPEFYNKLEDKYIKGGKKRE